MSHILEIRDVNFGYSAGAKVISDCSFKVQAGDIVALLGPSGCGKTTLLNLIAGLLKPDSGEIKLSSYYGDKLNRAGYVFQSPSLIPWLNTFENAIFGARIAGCSNPETLAEADKLLERYRLSEHTDKYPAALSGGMQQRVALIRAVLPNTKVLLLDEPFSGSDYLLQEELERDISELVTEKQLIALLVTHDLDQAMRLANRVVILSQIPSRVHAMWTIDLPRSARLQRTAEMAAQLAPLVNRAREEFAAGTRKS